MTSSEAAVVLERLPEDKDAIKFEGIQEKKAIDRSQVPPSRREREESRVPFMLLPEMINLGAKTRE